MIVASQNIDLTIKVFRHEVRKSGIVSQLLLKEIAKPSERRKAKDRIALRRKKQAEKRRGVYTEGKR
jgi:ribosomal protein S21